MRFHKFLEPTISHILVVNALNLVIGVTKNAFYKKALVLKLAEIAIREQGRHSSAEFPAFSWHMRTQLYCRGFRTSLFLIT
jgi:hypothetical protein